MVPVPYVLYNTGTVLLPTGFNSWFVVKNNVKYSVTHSCDIKMVLWYVTMFRTV